MLDNLKLPNETIDKIYDDGFHQSVAETGKIVGRIPRFINAAFASLDCWIAKREYNVEKTKQLLEENLKNADPEKIVSPEPYVAVPAIQAIMQWIAMNYALFTQIFWQNPYIKIRKILCIQLLQK